ncbi:nitroreductase family protein [Nonlabens ponticola]|uniref:Nitroreductase n=1 Tax=Nonlabens ponticola TaxID=2496866 RepID=A0A3S9MZ74_9FLAO|nr:nitroreductase family protein [Nonlabens ponticola]AZQ44363.1 nitroreductase [Nonlabens ponticola]
MSQPKTDVLKNTPTDHKVHDLIKNRWSPRKFADTPVSNTDLQSLFEAGRWAASSNNFQPWHIVWGVKGSESYDRIMDVLVEFNQGWAKNAPVLLLGVFDKKTPDGKDNFHALHDLGQFAANMAIQAQSMGIALHQMAGVDHEKAKKEFKFPDTFHVATAIAVGYYGGELDEVPEDLRSEETKERSRKKQEEFTYNGDYVDRAHVDKD